MEVGSWKLEVGSRKSEDPSRLNLVNEVLPFSGARDFSSGVSGFCQVIVVTRAKSLWPKICRPSASTENSRRAQEKPLVPRVMTSILVTRRDVSRATVAFGFLTNENEQRNKKTYD